jgi:peptidoglycan/xylan/chitin deacetylase (PgdA/CDA1 family)
MSQPIASSRREFLRRSAFVGAGLLAADVAARLPLISGARADEKQAPKKPAGRMADKALVNLTLDLEMSRNFPMWETTHWDYEKGNLDSDTKAYTVEACNRVRDLGGMVHCFCVGRVLEQENVDWLKALVADGHKVGNHTYDHVYVLAKDPKEVQFRFARSPWLMRGQAPFEVIRDNVRMTNEALLVRTGIKAAGFRTPGGFALGLDGREDVQKMLLDEGFTWVSSKYPAHATTKPGERPTKAVFDDIVRSQSAAQPFVYPTGLIEIPMSPISDIGAFRGGRWPLDDFLTAIRLGLEWCIEHKAVYDFLAHPSCLVATDPTFKALELICKIVKDSGGKAEIVGLDEVAARVAKSGV